MDLLGKTAFITGASRGLGLEIAKFFWKKGSSLVLLARSEDKLTTLKETFFKKTFFDGQSARVQAIDLAEPNFFRVLSHQINDLETKIDILVNNAAIQGPIGNVWENDWKRWQETIQVNLLAPVFLCRLCVPIMQKNNYGKIINLSGGGATFARENFSAYAVAKTALVRFTEILAKELKGYKIDVNCIAPGTMNTDLSNQLLALGPERLGHEEYLKINKVKIQDSLQEAIFLSAYLASPISDGISGRLLSAVWDPWSSLHETYAEIADTDIYTLRRIVPEDRNKIGQV